MSKHQIFRFVFSKECMDKLEEFTKTHILEERVQFKTSWLKWIIDNQEMINIESSILIAQGCQENIISKMFLCVRFYLKKKKLAAVIEVKNEAYIEKKVETKTKHVSNEILLFVNNHIKETISLSISPADLYKDFIIKYKKELDVSPRDIIKEKKTYKNRYYIIKNSVNLFPPDGPTRVFV